MRVLIFTLCVLFYSNLLLAQDNAKQVSTDINAVTIYLSGAQVSRMGKADLDAGITKLALTGISNKIDVRSIQVGLGSEVMILSVSYQTSPMTINPKKAPIIKFLTDSIEATKTELQIETDREFVLNQEQGLLLDNRHLQGEKGENVAEIEDGLVLYRKELPEIRKKIMLSKRRQTQLAQYVDSLTMQLREFSGSDQQNNMEILVTVSSDKRMMANIDLKYYVWNASWSPKYDIRAVGTTTPVNLTYKAEIKQNSGENWNNVKLTLSSSNPTLIGNIPELGKNWVSFYPERRILSYEDAEDLNPFRGNVYRVDKDSLGRIIYDDINNQYSSTINAGTIVQFEIKFPVKLNSDNQAQLVEINRFDITSLFKYIAIPKMDCDAFLQAKVTGWEDKNMLSGDGNMYYEGTFLGKTFINTHNTNDTLQLSLGRDKRIIVKREKVKSVSSKSFFGSRVKENIVWEIEIKNTKNEDVLIEVQDQLPVSNDKDIEVAADNLDGAEHNSETGRLTWNKTIPAGASAKIRFSYTIKYPKDKTVYGL